MKKYFITLAVCFSITFAPRAFAMENPDLEGWIVKIDATKSTIRILSANKDGEKEPHDKVVAVKPGWINGFKLDDYVQVKFRNDLRYALMIEKSAPRVGRQAETPK